MEVSFDLIMREPKYSQKKDKNKDPNSLRKIFILEIKVFVSIDQLIRRKRVNFFASLYFLLYEKRSLSNYIKQIKMLCRSLLKSKVPLEGKLKALASHLFLRKQHV